MAIVMDMPPSTTDRTGVVRPPALPPGLVLAAEPDPEPVPEPEPDPDPEPDPLVPLELPLPDDEGVEKVVGQVRLKDGVVERLFVMANLALLAGLESRRLYQKVGVLPNSFRQPISSQYVLALATLGTASSQLGPETGQPVSVSQTGLPPAAWTA